MSQASTSSRLTWRHADAHEPPRLCVIAEIGVNHDGDVERAVELVHAAAGAFEGYEGGAVKVQVFRAEQLMSRSAGLAEYQKQQGENDAVAMLQRLELSVEELQQVRDAARALGVGFVATPFSLPDLPTLEALDVDAVKIASPDAVNTPLLEAAGALGRPMIVSTGTCDLEELQSAANVIRSNQNIGSSRCDGALLHCVSAYPTPMDQAGLGGIQALHRAHGLPTGYSDHTVGIETGSLAVMAGACVLEKHLTWDRGAAGPDHAASLEPGPFREYVRLAYQAAVALGPIAKRVTDREREVRQLSRQSVCTTRKLPAGHVLTEADLALKRPGTGIPAASLQEVIGATLARAVGADTPLQPADLS